MEYVIPELELPRFGLEFENRDVYKGRAKMRFYNFYYHYDCSTFIFLDIAKRNTAFLLYRVLLRAGLITFISIVGFFLFTVIVFIWRTPAPPLPEITYGEFPFRLEYELNEKLHVIEDTLIVEFDGFWNERRHREIS